MTEHYYGSVGGFSLPLLASDIDDTDLSFASIDTAGTMMLGLFRQALISELSAAWTKVCAGLDSSHPLYASTSPVADYIGMEPTPELMQERKPDFPLLALHRAGAPLLQQHTLQEIKRTQPWHLHYILCPRHSIETDQKLAPVFEWVSIFIAKAIEHRSHPDYDSGNLQFFSTDTDDTLAHRAPVGSVRIVTSAIGQAVFAEGADATRYPTLRMELETEEYGDETLAAFPTVSGMDLHENVGNEVEVIQDFLVADTDFPGPMWD